MLDIFYPHRCPICDDVLPVGIDCTACVKCERIVQKAVRPYCMKCGKPIGDERKEFCTDCEKREHFYLQGKAAFVYDKYMQKSIAAFKYRGRREYGNYYAEQIVKKHKKWIETIGALKSIIHSFCQRSTNCFSMMASGLPSPRAFDMAVYAVL